MSTARLLTVSADRTEFCREWQGFCFPHRSSSMSVLLLGWSRDRKKWPNTEPPKYISFPRNIFGGNEIYLEGSKYISMERNIFRGNEIYFEGTKYISRERNNISEFPTCPFRGSVDIRHIFDVYPHCHDQWYWHSCPHTQGYYWVRFHTTLATNNGMAKGNVYPQSKYT